MEYEILEHRKRLDILQKHLKSNYYNVGQYHQVISDAMKEYAEQTIVNGVSTSQDQALNLAGVTGSALKSDETIHYEALKDCCNKLLDEVEKGNTPRRQLTGLKLLLNR